MGLFSKKKKKKAKRTTPTSKVATKSASKATSKPKQKGKTQEPNQWRNSKGVDEPLRIGRGIRTRDEYYAGQDGKEIHSEIDERELYRRSVVLDIDEYILSNQRIIRIYRMTQINESMNAESRQHLVAIKS